MGRCELFKDVTISLARSGATLDIYHGMLKLFDIHFAALEKLYFMVRRFIDLLESDGGKGTHDEEISSTATSMWEHARTNHVKAGETFEAHHNIQEKDMEPASGSDVEAPEEIPQTKSFSTTAVTAPYLELSFRAQSSTDSLTASLLRNKLGLEIEVNIGRSKRVENAIAVRTSPKGLESEGSEAVTDTTSSQA